MKKLRNYIMAVLLVATGVLAYSPVVANAYDPLDSACNGANATSDVCKNRNEEVSDYVGPIINALLFIVGALSVIMIIVAGFFYTTSNGDSNKVSRAKNTLTYAIVGLVVAFLAYAIVNWVVEII